MIPSSSSTQALSSPLLRNPQFVVQNYGSTFSHLVHSSATRKLEKRRELALNPTPPRPVELSQDGHTYGVTNYIFQKWLQKYPLCMSSSTV